jgi:hypothetical protein
MLLSYKVVSALKVFVQIPHCLVSVVGGRLGAV